MPPLHLNRTLPSHAEFTTFLQTFLPPQAPATTTITKRDGNIATITKSDVPFLYHTPRHPAYSPTRNLVSKVIFSITPTSGVYSAFHTRSVHAPDQSPADANAHASAVCFLHRPWSLDRRAVPRGALILASHVSFDAYLTVGWSVSLAARLNVEMDSVRCIQGYKGDPERRIGLVGKLKTSTSLAAITDLIRGEFDGAGELYQLPAEDTPEISSVPSTTIDAVAIMNAFHAEEVERVTSTAEALLPASTDPFGPRILYLTGAARELGLESAKAANMPAFCVGHRACEEWGIKYLAQMTRERWPALDIIEVLEDEEKSEVREKKDPVSGQTVRSSDKH